MNNAKLSFLGRIFRPLTLNFLFVFSKKKGNEILFAKINVTLPKRLAMIKAALPKGTRDFTPEQLAKRQFIIEKIKNAFERSGFQPVETPAFEKLETLTGKYGNEGDKLIFKILNSGDFLKKVPPAVYEEKNASKMVPYISEKALRYDLTVPLARYVVMHRNEIVFPFKRYQIQPVWRADRPQKGRFREFYQCDADVLGSKSLWQEVEFIQLYNDVFSELKIPVEIRINHRKILNGIIHKFNLEDVKQPFMTALDKLDKIGWDKVVAEWQKSGISAQTAFKLREIFSISPDKMPEHLEPLLRDIPEGMEGVEELKTVLSRVSPLSHAELVPDLSLARGLDYYTGTIMEVRAKSVQMGSLGGGGRYDNLTEIFGVKDISGAGISFGLDRILLVMEEMKLFEGLRGFEPQVMFVNFGDKEAAYSWKAVKKLRETGISAELYPDAVKLKKQLQYAAKRNIPFVVMAGEDEMKAQKFTLKNMQEGSQTQLDFEEMRKIIGTGKN